MIYTQRTILISNSTATMDSAILLYRGDREVEIRFTIVDSKFRFKSNNGNVIDNNHASYGQLAISLPDGTNLFSDVTETQNGVVIFTITGDMIDELHEIGFYSFHIRLFNDDKTSRITLPPVMRGIEVREPLVIDDDTTDTAIVGYSAIQTYGVEEPAFDEDGNYIKTDWQTGDKITASKLNKIEETLETINNGILSKTSELVNDSNFLTSVPSEYVTDSELNMYSAFGTCDTEAATAEKVVVIDNPNWKLQIGNMITVRFSIANTASNVTLNVNNTGAYGIDITSDVVSDGVINIPSVTGDIKITVTTKADGSSDTPDTPTENFTNQIPLSVNADGSSYVGINGEKGYTVGYRISSSGVESQVEGMCCSGYIPCTAGQVVRMANVTIGGPNTNYLVHYNPDKSFRVANDITAVFTPDDKGVYTYTCFKDGFIRISCGGIDETSIITLDEPINL